MEKVGINLKILDNNIYKSYSLKKFGTETGKKELILNTKNSVNKFKLSDPKEEEDNNLKNNKLIKANNKIINIISNCMVKIQNENNNKDNIDSNLNTSLKNPFSNKETKKKNKKNVKFNDNNNNKLLRIFSKKSQKSKNSLNKIKHISSNKLIKDSHRTVHNEIYRRIGTTSHLPKEKEKEIVFNISSSLISLYKLDKKFSVASFDKNKLNHLKPRRFSLKVSKFKKNSKGSSKDEYCNSNLSNDSQNIKKYSKPKKFPTFIVPNKNKQKKSKYQINYKTKKHISESLFQSKTDLLASGIKTNINTNKRGSDIGKTKNTRRNSFHIINWPNNLKDNEHLTEREYVHIQHDLKESLIGYKNTRLEEDLKNLENTETTDLIKKLPTLKRKNSNTTSLDYTMSVSNNNMKIDKEKFRFLQHTGYVYDSLDDEEAEDAIDINYYYISPDSVYIYIFDSIIALLSFYCLFYFPYYLAHDYFFILSSLNIKIIIFYIIDIFYILDLIISFFRAYLNYDEILIKNITDMSCNYINSWFFPDLFAAIPFYSIINLIEKKDNNIDNLNEYHSLSYLGVKIYKMHYLLILNKLMKIFKCLSYNNRALSKLIQILFKNDRIEEKSGLFLIIFILLSACNFGSCIFVFIGRNSYPSWMTEMEIYNNSFTSVYICSLYYLFATITTVGYGDIHGRSIQEIFFQIILLLIGTITYSYLISSVSNYIKKINKK